MFSIPTGAGKFTFVAYLHLEMFKLKTRKYFPIIWKDGPENMGFPKSPFQLYKQVVPRRNYQTHGYWD